MAKRISYFYDGSIGNFSYGPVHPMKPHRVRMTHELIMNYGLASGMEITRPRLLLPEEMKSYHTPDYVDFLHIINPDMVTKYKQHCERYRINDDSTVFDGLFRYCQITAGGSV
ncbi:MAG: putative histone deacetylase, partial [Streblomastix strix]